MIIFLTANVFDQVRKGSRSWRIAPEAFAGIPHPRDVAFRSPQTQSLGLGRYPLSRQRQAKGVGRNGSPPQKQKGVIATLNTLLRSSANVLKASRPSARSSAALASIKTGRSLLQ